MERKVVGPDCQCPKKCYQRLGLETIIKLFNEFWSLADNNAQNVYLFQQMKLCQVKRRYTKEKNSRRNYTMNYFVKKRENNIIVCKKAFLNIHGLQKNQGRVNNLVNKMKEGGSVLSPDKRGRHLNRPNAYTTEAIKHVWKHLELCQTSKSEARILNKTALSTKESYELYVNTYCIEHGLIPVSLDKFRRIIAQNKNMEKNLKKKNDT